MKHLISISITALLLSASLLSSAQTDQGNVLIAGESNLHAISSSSSWKSDEDKGDFGKSFYFNFTPIAGYFIVENLAIGGMLSLDYSTDKDENDYKGSSSTAVLMPFARYYFGADMIRPFVELAAGLGRSKVHSEGREYENEYKASVRQAQLLGGIDIFFTDNIALDLGLGYFHTTSKPKEDNVDNYRSITKGFGLKGGIVVVF